MNGAINGQTGVFQWFINREGALFHQAFIP
jgi:hypothetical protein